jgi:hypothetical protein
MAWKWYQINDYKVSVGGQGYYGGVQLFGEGFYGFLKFHKEGPLPNASDPTSFGQRFYGHMDYQQMRDIVDILRNEKPVNFGWYDENPNLFHLMTGAEPVGEGEGVISEGTP